MDIREVWIEKKGSGLPSERELVAEILRSLLDIPASTEARIVGKQMKHVLKWMNEVIPLWVSSREMKTSDQLLTYQRENILSCLELASALEGEGIKQRCEDQQFQDESKNIILDVQNAWQATRKVDNVYIKLAAGGKVPLNDIRYCGPKPPSKRKEKK